MNQNWRVRRASPTVKPEASWGSRQPGPRRRRGGVRGRDRHRCAHRSPRGGADELGGGQAQNEHEDGGSEGRLAPAERVDAADDQVDNDAAEGEPSRDETDGGGAVALEPVDDRDHDGEEATQAHPHRDDKEVGKRWPSWDIWLKSIEPSGQDHEADADDGAGTEAVGEIPLAGAYDAVRALDGGVAEREHRAAPAELRLEDGDVGAVGVHDERADEGVEDHARADDDPPAVEELAGMCATCTATPAGEREREASHRAAAARRPPDGSSGAPCGGCGREQDAQAALRPEAHLAPLGGASPR